MFDHDIETERRRLANRLEQDVIASLALLQAQTAAYEQALRQNPQAHMAIGVISSLIQQAIGRARHLQNNLNPSLLETLGLEPALEAYASELNRIHGFKVELHLERLKARLSTTQETALFRLTQSLIDLSREYAHSAHFIIRLSQKQEFTTYSYQDDGQWTPQEIQQLRPTIEPIRVHAHSVNIQRLPTDELSVQVILTSQISATLTPRELEILASVAEGMTNKQIAQRLMVSARTVNFHLDNVYSKLGVSTRTEAVLHAMREGWLQEPSK